VNPNLTPAISLSISANTFCTTDTVSLTATLTNGGSAPIIAFYKNNQVLQNTSSLTWKGAGILSIDTFYAVLTANNACQTTTTATSNKVSGTNPAGVVINAQPQNSRITAGQSTTFSVSATNALLYQWQIDNGSGFVNISPSATYSGSTTSTLNISSASVSENGKLYRCQIVGNCSSYISISNTASLSVGNPPQNDECIQAQVLTTNAGAIVSNSIYATESKAACTGVSAKDVWFQFTANTGSVNILVVPSGSADVVIEGFSGSCNSLNSLGCINQLGAGRQETLNLINLTSSNTYYVRVYNADGSNGSNSAFRIELREQITWDGTQWLNGTPSGTTGLKDITIRQGTNVTIPNNAKFRNITILPGASINIDNTSVYMSGNFNAIGGTIIDGVGTINVSGSGTRQGFSGGMVYCKGIINVNSGALLNPTGNLTLIDDGILLHGTGTPGSGGGFSGHIIMRRQGSTNSKKYNLWATPVNSTNARYLEGNDIRSFNSSTQTWSPILTNSTNLSPGIGYASNGNLSGMGGNGIRQFAGTPNVGQIDVPLSVNPGVNDDWNLVGNPYPSPISGNKFLSDNSASITGSVYFWNNSSLSPTKKTSFSTSDFVVMNSVTGDFVIPSCQGFFVEAKGTNLAFTNQQRTNNNDVLYRSSSKSEFKKIYLRLSQEIEGKSWVSDALLAFHPNATEGFDEGMDARKFPNQKGLGLYALVENEAMSIVALNEPFAYHTIGLGMFQNANTPMRLQLDTQINLDASIAVYLEDKEKGVFTDLRANEYSFSLNSEKTNEKRFVLHVNPGAARSNAPKSQAKIWAENMNIHFLFPTYIGKVKSFDVIDLSGRIVQRMMDFGINEHYSQEVALEEGVYIARFETDNGTFTEKVILSR
jgi:hypothetical protein